MGSIQLKHVRKYEQEGASLETYRLLGELARLTRPFFEDDEAVIDFDEVERLAGEALELLFQHADWMAGHVGIAVSGELHWIESADPEVLLRKPTREEVIALVGESGLMWGALKHASNAEESMRLSAAFGVYCCERALDGVTKRDIGEIIKHYAAAGVMLGDATYMVGIQAESGLAEDRYKRPLRAGGRRRWEAHPTQQVKLTMHEHWKQWQGDRSRYAKSSDFRAKMLSAHGAVVNEGTLKNWMTEWRKNWEPSRS